tara:strand:- start:183 stop:311 length:129 start_codon:yes stop_codon:yes gene_type:complete
MTDAANRTTGGAKAPPTLKEQQWKRRSTHFGDVPSAEKKASF